jgi:hypothetical protein
VNGDGFDDVIVGADAGPIGGHVKAFNGQTGAELLSFLSFAGWSGGVSVAAADLNLDGRAEIIAGAGSQGHVKVFDSAAAQFNSGSFIGSFFTFSGFIGQISVASGDVNGDGRPEIVVGAGAGGAGGHVKAFSSVNNAVLDSFFAFETNFLGGANVSVADFNSDGRYEIGVAPGPGRASEVRGFDGKTQSIIEGFEAFGNWSGGTFLGGTRGA